MNRHMRLPVLSRECTRERYTQGGKRITKVIPISHIHTLSGKSCNSLWIQGICSESINVDKDTPMWPFVCHTEVPQLPHRCHRIRGLPRAAGQTDELVHLVRILTERLS
jgi:hypothetical protein